MNAEGVWVKRVEYNRVSLYHDMECGGERGRDAEETHCIECDISEHTE